MLGLHKNILDFEILETNNSKTLVFLDSSSYIEEPDRPLMEITFPGYSKYFLVNVLSKRLNTFNSNTLGLSRVLNCTELVDLPDGLYEIKFKVCPYDYNYVIKKFMRVTLLNQKIQNIYTQIDLKNPLLDKQFKDDLIDIHLLIEGSRADANLNSKRAVDYYNTASSIADKLLMRLCQNCK